MEKMVVTAIDVLSTAKKIEVSASTGEYLMTAKGIRLDVGTKRKLFLTQHTFEEAQDKCSLKVGAPFVPGSYLFCVRFLVCFGTVEIPL